MQSLRTAGLKRGAELPFASIAMDSPSHRPSVAAPRQGLSIAPVSSIFTLRPRAQTVKPPEPESKSRAVRWAPLLLVAAGAGALGWYFTRPDRQETKVPVVFVNGAPEQKLSDQGQPERWGDLPVTVRIDAAFAKLGPGAVSAVQSGFGAWVASDAKLPALTFDSASGLVPKLEPDGVNAVIFAPIDIPGHKTDLAITISFVDAASGRILEADVIVNAKKKYAVLGAEGAASPGEPAGSDDDDDSEHAHEVEGCQYQYDLQAVLAHEAGHFFGLGEDRDDLANTMFFKTGKCEIKKRDLEPPDKSVMTALYLQPAPAAEASADTGGGCGGASVVARAKPGASAATLLALSLFWLARRRRQPQE